MAVVEAGLRLATLFHDLGHLPFSHDAEYALKDYAAAHQAQASALHPDLMAIAGEEAPHEEIGHRLAEVVFQTLASDQSPAVKAAFDMAIAILNTKTPKYHLQKRPHASPMQWLHSLVDGEIDADRADYLLRDGRALGLDFAHYDVDRLVSNLILVHDPDLGFVTAVKETGLAALESYCLSRSRSNQVFVRHHKVAQTAIALRHASVAAFGHPASGDFLQVLQELGSTNLLKKANLLEQFGRFDDTWWVQVLRQLQESNTDPLTRACLDLVLDRARTLQSVWKRKGDLTDEQAKKINSRVDGLFASPGYAIALADRRKHLLDQGILIMPFKFKPYARCEPEADGRSVMLVKSKTGTEPASKVSPLIRHLHDLWEQEVHLYAFTHSGCTVSAEDVISSLWERQAESRISTEQLTKSQPQLIIQVRLGASWSDFSMFDLQAALANYAGTYEFDQLEEILRNVRRTHLAEMSPEIGFNEVFTLASKWGLIRENETGKFQVCPRKAA